MSQRLNDYFASEATEYLDQLERLLALPGPPDADQLLRLATGVRGSAQMAGAETVAGVAERLEDAARSIVSANLSWSEELRELSRQTVGDLKLLVRALNRWGHEEERRVRDAITRWEGIDEVAGAAAAVAVLPVSDLFYDDGGPHVIEQGARPGDTVSVAEVRPDGGARPDEPVSTVSVDRLLFRGEAALREALSLRPEIDRSLRGDGGSRRPLDEILAEVFDLIELGLSPEPPEE